MIKSPKAGDGLESFTLRLKPEVKKGLFEMSKEVGNPVASLVRPLLNTLLEEWKAKKAA